MKRATRFLFAVITTQSDPAQPQAKAWRMHEWLNVRE